MHLHARRAGWILAGLLTLAGLGYSMVLGPGTRFPDERDYLAIAESLARTGTYSLDGRTPNAIRPPGYPMLIAPVAAAAGAVAPRLAGADATPERIAERARALTVHAVRTLQFLGLALAALLLGSLAGVPARARTMSGPAPPDAGRRDAGRARLGAAMLVALAAYPVLIYTAGTLFPQTALLVLATLVLWLLVRARPGVASAGAVGLLCGAAAEVSPTALTIVPMALLHAALSGRWRARHVGVIALAAALLPGAWLARNLVTLDEPILFSRNLAYNLDNAVLELDPVRAAEVREPDDAIGYGAERLAQLLGAPRAYLERLARHFAWRNDMQVTEESSRARDRVMLVSYAALLALVALRLILARRRPLTPAERSVLALYAMTAAFHALVFVRIRYRVPFDFLLLLPALNAVLASLARVRDRRAPSVTAP